MIPNFIFLPFFVRKGHKTHVQGVRGQRGSTTSITEAQIFLFLKKRWGVPVGTLLPHRSKAERRRHRRKYADGELPPDRSFFFRGPNGKLNLRAQNLQMFLQIAE